MEEYFNDGGPGEDRGSRDKLLSGFAGTKAELLKHLAEPGILTVR